MRSTDFVLIVLSVVIIGLAGFAPLFGGRDRNDAIRHECEVFYGPSGPDATARCLAEMSDRWRQPGR